jgi:acetyl-CoA decarbonylase/synthase, CODH/ACS complex subunit gamma
MALSGLDIFKMLPKTNCKDCGFPTCLAFAMQLAAGKIELGKCPHVSEQAKSSLSEASQPPVLGVEVGVGEEKFKVGEETVLFRHERTFVNQNAFAVAISDENDLAKIEEDIKKIEEVKYERVGQVLKIDSIAIINKSNDKAKFLDAAKKAASITKKPLILVCENAEILAEAAKALKDLKPLLSGANSSNSDKVLEICKETGCPVVVSGKDFSQTGDMVEKFRAQGIKNIILNIGSENLRENFSNQVILRRAAIKKKIRTFGYPTIVFPNLMTSDPLKEAAIASIFVAKYAGIIVISNADYENIFPLMIYRQNIYTDPRKPMQVVEKIYEIGNPDKNSPVLITTNFSLTYFIVSGEVENSKVPVWLLVMNVEGQSVLTAWASGKFIPEEIAKFIKRSGIEEKTSKKEIIIPGYVAQLKGELEDELSGWSIVVGPRESGEIAKFLKSYRQ